MLHIYGNLLPLRMLEEIWHWKHLESRHVQTVISAVPELEPAYVHHLQDWDHVFERTRYKAGELFNQLWEEQLEAEEQHALELGEELEQLLAAARRQSEEFVHHLSLLETRSVRCGTIRRHQTYFAMPQRTVGIFSALPSPSSTRGYPAYL